MDSTARKKLPPTAIMAIALAFFMKFAIFGLFITPLWDIPDESGHYSYVEDIAAGHIPRLGSALMGVDVTHSWISPEARPGANWIAQHPPLYYVISAPALITARALGLDFDGQVRSVRLVSALFGALALLGIMLSIIELTGNKVLAIAGGVFVGCTPMFLQLGSGVSHDTLVACTAAWAAFWCVRWGRTDDFLHALLCGLFVALSLVTKYTGLVVAIPLFFAMGFRLWRQDTPLDPKRALTRCAALWLVMFIPIMLWMTRNFILFHALLPLGTVTSKAPPRVHIGFLQYATTTPFWRETLLNYVGLIGWNGRGGGRLDWVQIMGPTAIYFLASIFFCATAVTLSSVAHVWRRIGARTVIIISVIFTGYATATMDMLALAGVTCTAISVALLTALAAHLPSAIRGDYRSWLFATGSLCTIFFSFVFFEHLWATYDGVLRATHGRYYYPVLPFLALIFAWPLRGRRTSQVALFAALLAMIFSDRFFLHHALNLYGQL